MSETTGELEQQLETAVKGLTRRPYIKIDHLQIFEETLSEPDCFHDQLRPIIDNKNVQMALNEAIYTKEMSRLLTLRAILIPSTLPQFLGWLLAKKESKKENREHYQHSLDFQKQVLEYFKQNRDNWSNSEAKIKDGLVNIFPTLLNQPNLLPAVVWLLQSKEGLWGDIYQREIVKDIDHDLLLIGKQPLSFIFNKEKKQDNKFQLMILPNWDRIYRDIKRIVTSSERLVNKEYLVFAQLFTALNNYPFAALFYQFSQKKVPKKVFEQLSGSRAGKVVQLSLYGVSLRKETIWLDNLLLRRKPDKSSQTRLVFKGQAQELIITFITYIIFLFSLIFSASGIKIFSEYIINNTELEGKEIESMELEGTESEDYGKLKFIGNTKDIFIPAIFSVILNIYVPFYLPYYYLITLYLPFLSPIIVGINFIIFKWLVSNIELSAKHRFQFKGSYYKFLIRNYIFVFIKMLTYLVFFLILVRANFSVSNIFDLFRVDTSSLTPEQQKAIDLYYCVYFISIIASFYYSFYNYLPWIFRNIKNHEIQLNFKITIFSCVRVILRIFLWILVGFFVIFDSSLICLIIGISLDGINLILGIITIALVIILIVKTIMLMINWFYQGILVESKIDR